MGKQAQRSMSVQSQSVNRRVLEPKVPHKHAPPVPHRESMSRHAITAPAAKNHHGAPRPAAAAPAAPAFPTFNFSSYAGGEDDDDSDDDYEDEDDADDDDDWLFAVDGSMSPDDARGGFELDESAMVLKIDANACKSLEDVTTVVQEQAQEETPAEDSAVESAKNCVRALADSAELLLIFSKLTNKVATEAVAQWLQCIEAVVVEREESDEESLLLLAVLEGWKDKRIVGVSLQNTEQAWAIPCSRIEGCDEDPWIYKCTAEQSLDELKGLLNVPSDVTVLELKANESWTGMKSVTDAIKKAAGQTLIPQKAKKTPQAGASPQKVKKMLREVVTNLLSTSSVFLRICVTEDNGWCSHGAGVKGASAAGFVCQLLQLVASVVEASQEGHTAHAVLVGWTSRKICGPDVLDSTASAKLRVGSWLEDDDEDEEEEEEEEGDDDDDDDSDVQPKIVESDRPQWDLNPNVAGSQWTVDMRAPHTPESTFGEDLEKDIFHLIAAKEYEKGAKLVEQLPHGRAGGEFGQRVIELLQDKDDCYGILKLLQQLKLNGATTALIEQYVPEAEV